MADIEGSKKYEEPKSSHGEYFQSEGLGEIEAETVRGLSSRHIQFLALGTLSIACPLEAKAVFQPLFRQANR